MGDRFELAIRNAPETRIEDFLPGDNSKRLLTALLEIELEVLLERGKVPSVDQYKERFAGNMSEVGLAFQNFHRRFPELLQKTVLSQEPQSASADHRFDFSIVAGVEPGAHRSVDTAASITAGRSQKADLYVGDDRQCSRQHCRFSVRDGLCEVVDLNSRNGTFVNGKRIASQRLDDGDVISIGKAQIVMRVRSIDDANVATVIGDVGGGGSEELAPSEIGPYRITGRLGQGAMGVVFSAIHKSKNEMVAIKLIQPDVAVGPEVLQLFLREASILRGLDHPRIVGSREFGLNENRPYFVMEYVPSLNFETLLAKQTLPHRIRLATYIVSQVLNGLQFAHDQGIVHRDVKPTNLLVYRSGERINCKLADFGLAKRFEDAGMSAMTEDNQTRGTIAYMPPEQLLDARYAKPACDIFAAGICLYRFLTGRLPYETANGPGLVICVQDHRLIPIIDVLPECPQPLAEVISHAVNRRPEDRPTAAEMQAALKSFTKVRHVG
ncbi:MAG: protein kinase [Planctomycetaceae bacterium]|nr:protein kinase [Planctomycetaceae bacterium]